MQIDELTNEEALAFLTGKDFGRLACVKNSQPYVTPCSFVYHKHSIYCFSTVGKRIEWLRANPLACLEVDDIISTREWTSVVVFGCYHELTQSPEQRSDRTLAHDLLSQRPGWWEPGYVRTTLQGVQRELDPVYFRLSIAEISGHRARPG